MELMKNNKINMKNTRCKNPPRILSLTVIVK